MTRPARRRRRWLLLILVLGVAAWCAGRTPEWAARLTAGGLTSFFHRPCTVSAVRFHGLPFEAEILDLRVGGATSTALPFLEAPRVIVTPSLFSFFGGPRRVISRVRIQGLKLRITAFQEGGDDIPKMGGGAGGGGRDVRIRRLTIEDGEFMLNHYRVPLNLDLPEFEGRLTARRGGALAGRVSFGTGNIQFGTAPQWPLGTEIHLMLEGSLLTVESAHLRTKRTDLAYSGQIRIAAKPVGEFKVHGPVDLDELDRHLMRTGFGIKGDALYDGTLGVEGSRLRLNGRLTGTSGVFDEVPVPRFGGDLSWDERGVLLRQLEVDTLGGKAVIDLAIPPGKSAARLDAAYESVDADGAVQAIFDIGAVGVASAATGKATLSWPRGRFREFTGEIALDLAPKDDGRTPLSGRFEWHARNGLQTIDRADLRTPATRARLDGTIDVRDRLDLSVNAESLDLAATDDLAVRWRRAIGTEDAIVAGFAGRGTFRGRCRGTLDVPEFEGRFSGHDVGYLGVVWGQADWSGSADPFEVRSHSLVLRRPAPRSRSDRAQGGTPGFTPGVPDAELWLDGTSETGDYGLRDGLDVRVRLDNWPAADLIHALEWDLDLTGSVTGEVQVRGFRSRPTGSAKLTARSGLYYGIPYDAVAVESVLREREAEVTRGHVEVGGGTVVFRGTVTDDAVYDGTATLEHVDLTDVAKPAGPRARWGGRVSGDVAFQGTLTRPRLSARIYSPRIFFGDEGLGALDGALDGHGDGAVAFAVTCRSPRVDVKLQGRVRAEFPYEADLHVAGRQTSLDPFLRAVFPRVPPDVGIVVSGAMDLSGPLGKPREARAEAILDDVHILFPEHPVRSQHPVRLAVRAGRLEIENVQLAGEGTRLTVAGGAAFLEDDAPVEVTLSGEADLRVLTALTRRIRGRGTARLKVDVSGTPKVPRVDGSLALDGAGLSFRGFPHGLEAVHGTVRFTETTARVAGLAGTLGGGDVTLEGETAYDREGLRSFDFHALGRRLVLRYPEGLRSQIDADLRFVGDRARQWVTGDVDVRQALWTRRYDVASELLAAAPAPQERRASLTEGLRYDVQVRVPGTFTVDNNLATLDARAELSLQGTYEAPVVLGRAEIERGRVYFQGNTYVIRRGAIEFANPQKIDPFFDIEAEARVRSYRVTLKANGTLERVYPTLTSDPPLTALQILNLLAGADESAVASLAQAEREQAWLGVTGAATLAAGRIAEEVGLEKGVERLFGLNRFSIDPQSLNTALREGNLANASARLTVGKRLTPSLNVLYAQDVKGREERILSIEYYLSDRVSLLLTREQRLGGPKDENYGFDVLLRHSK